MILDIQVRKNSSERQYQKYIKGSVGVAGYETRKNPGRENYTVELSRGARGTGKTPTYRVSAGDNGKYSVNSGSHTTRISTPDNSSARSTAKSIGRYMTKVARRSANEEYDD